LGGMGREQRGAVSRNLCILKNSETAEHSYLDVRSMQRGSAKFSGRTFGFVVRAATLARARARCDRCASSRARFLCPRQHVLAACSTSASQRLQPADRTSSTSRPVAHGAPS
jgi:hypothetical protein